MQTQPGLTPERILHMGMSYWASRTLLSAVELGVFSELAGGPVEGESLRQRLGLHARSARDFFDALVALGFLQRSGSAYRNAPDADFFLDRAKPSYMGGILEMSSLRLYGFWNGLTAALRSGEPQSEARNGAEDPFTALYADPARLRSFLSAMTGISRGSNAAVARQFPWARYQTFADIGAAQGDLAVQIALANPHLEGTGFDLAAVAPVFCEYAQAHGLAGRLRFQAGDFFNDPLPHADVITLGHILHDWDLPTKQALLAKAYAALPDGGAIVVYDAIIDDDRSHNAFGLLMSLNMLIETPGGFDYTGADCAAWMRAAGFRETRQEALAGPDSMVIGFK